MQDSPLRCDGFAGQHMIVLPEPVRVEARRHPLLRGLHAADAGHERVSASVEKLRREWMRPNRLEELATSAGVSVSHYSALFRRQTGFSPIDFIIRLRIKHACRLLDTTDLSIGQIAARIGFDDAFYFARRFRRVMGCFPRAYRKVQKG